MRGRVVVCLALGLVFATGPAGSQTLNCQIPIPTLKDRFIGESIARYTGNRPCP